MRTTGVRRVAAAAVAVVLSAVLAGCSSDGYPAGSTMARIAESGSIAVGVKFDQPLFGELDEGGVPQGFDTEIVRILADELGVAEGGIVWSEAVSGSRETMLADGDVDVVVATYTMSRERQQQVGFAGPYYVAGQSLLTRTDDASISGVADLEGKDVCSVQGSTAARTVGDLAPGANLVLFDEYSACLDPLRNGQVDVITTDDVILAGYAAQSEGQFRLVGGNFTSEPYGVGIALGDDEFRSWVNEVLESAIDDGRWKAAWDGTAGAVLPEPQRPYIDHDGS